MPDETPKPPRCPHCAEEGIETEVVLVEHGYHMSPVHWDAVVSDWVTYPDEWLRSWNGDESYWQCNICFWQGGDPLGVEPEDS
jgi:hypothetical protein